MAGRNEKNNNEKKISAERIWATAQLYCDQVREIGKVVLQYSHCTCDMAQALGVGARKRRRVGGGEQGRWALGMREPGKQECCMGGTARRGEREALRHGAYALRYGRLGTHDTMLARLRHGHARAAWALHVRAG